MPTQQEKQLQGAINIGPYPVPIYLVPANSLREHGQDPEVEVYGMFVSMNREILLADNMPEKHLRETVLHEIVEAIVHIYDFAEHVPHAAIQTLGVALLQALEDKIAWDRLIGATSPR